MANSGLPVWEEWSNEAGGSKCIIFDADFTQAKIGMMNQEVLKEDLMAEINSLPATEKDMVMLLSWWWRL